MNLKVKSFKWCSYQISIQCQKLQHLLEVQSVGLDNDTHPQSFCHLFTALLIIYCSKFAQKFAILGCQVAAVIETTQLVLSQFKNYSEY